MFIPKQRALQYRGRGISPHTRDQQIVNKYQNIVYNMPQHIVNHRFTILPEHLFHDKLLSQHREECMEDKRGEDRQRTIQRNCQRCPGTHQIVDQSSIDACTSGRDAVCGVGMRNVLLECRTLWGGKINSWMTT